MTLATTSSPPERGSSKPFSGLHVVRHHNVQSIPIMDNWSDGDGEQCQVRSSEN